MNKIIKILESLLMAVLLIAAADARDCVALQMDRSESSSENHRECSADEILCRLSQAAQIGVTHQLLKKIPSYSKHFNRSSALFLSVGKNYSRFITTPDFAHIVLSTTILRI